ncbi:MAG: DUF4988 domain-containing protein, partial [Prevotellaceae bacterium]|nr:DUF4988 domain-containing protein [Prevotellaceae bacterium]
MKKITTIIFTAIMLAISGCQEYNDSALWTELENQAKRIATIEAWQATVNNNIGALQGIVTALQANDYVTSVDSFSTPSPGGYYIHFTKSPKATVWNGVKGDKGDVPQIGVKQEADVYYWTLNSEWLTDGSGQKIPTTGSKGEKGDEGVTPQLRINATTNHWEVCLTGTCTDESEWSEVLDSDGKPVAATGPQGDAIFAENGVDNSNPDYVEFTLADGATKIKVAKY